MEKEKINMPELKLIDHRGPMRVDVRGAWYFITICAEERCNYGRAVVPPTAECGVECVLNDGRAVVPPTAECGVECVLNDGRAVVPPTAECVECPNTPFIVHANEILECARYYHTHGKWHLALFLIMPDHIHFIVHVPSNPAVGGTTALPHVIGHWKHYVAEHYGLRFQRDFWDTRLRDAVHYAEMYEYILRNPERKGLAAGGGTTALPRGHAGRVPLPNWPYVIAFDRESGEERMHK